MPISLRARRVAVEVLVLVAALAFDLVVWHGKQILRTGQVLPIWVVPVLSVLVYPVLLLRRERPVAVFAVLWGYAVLALAVPVYVPVAGLLVALYGVSARLGVRTSAVALASCALPLGVAGYDAAVRSSPDRFAVDLAVVLLLYAATVACAWGLGRVRRRADRSTQRAQERQTEIAAEAVQDERLRLARELHDIVAHAVTAMVLQAAGARKLADTDRPQVGQALGVIESAGVQAMHELHRLLDLLRGDGEDAVDVSEAATALQLGLQDVPDLVELSQSGGADVALVTCGRARTLDRSVDLAAYRVIQESLTNAAKHGGPMVSVRVRLLWSDGLLTILVRSAPGRAAAAPVDTAAFSSGRGLIGLTERVRLVGGTLTAGPDAEAFVVRAELPVGSVAGHSSVAR